MPRESSAAPSPDGVAAPVFDLTGHRHRQHAVRPRRGAQGDVITGQPPVLVGDQMDHLVHHTVTNPSPLLPRRAVGEGVEGVHLRGADARLIEPVQFWVATAERGSTGERVVVLTHRNVADGDLAGSRRNH